MAIACNSSHSLNDEVQDSLLDTNIWLLCRILSHTIFHYTRLSNEQDIICFDFESAHISMPRRPNRGTNRQ